MERFLITAGCGFIGHGATPSNIRAVAPLADWLFAAPARAAPFDRHAWHG